MTKKTYGVEKYLINFLKKNLEKCSKDIDSILLAILLKKPRKRSNQFYTKV